MVARFRELDARGTDKFDRSGSRAGKKTSTDPGQHYSSTIAQGRSFPSRERGAFPQKKTHLVFDFVGFGSVENTRLCF